MKSFKNYYNFIQDNTPKWDLNLYSQRPKNMSYDIKFNFDDVTD